jgi:hypothetical protein
VNGQAHQLLVDDRDVDRRGLLRRGGVIVTATVAGVSAVVAAQRRGFYPPEHHVADKHGDGSQVLRGPSRRAGTRCSFLFADVARTGTGRCCSTRSTVGCVLQASVALRLP